MQRFQQKKRHSARNLWLSVIAFCLVISLFYIGVSFFSRVSLDEQKKSLENAIQKGVIQCYTIEGTYPESLQYLKEHYGITYDSTRFFVDYQISGSNMMPDITVLPLN